MFPAVHRGFVPCHFLEEGPSRVAVFLLVASAQIPMFLTIANMLNAFSETPPSQSLLLIIVLVVTLSCRF